MNVKELKKSNFLTQHECEPAILVTIAGLEQQNVAMEGADEELKHCLTFEEDCKPLVLNSTNGQLIAQILGSDETDEWVGGKIVLYRDPSIQFGGRLVGGIRVRAPKKQSTTPARPAAKPATAKTGAKPAVRRPAKIDPEDVPPGDEADSAGEEAGDNEPF